MVATMLGHQWDLLTFNIHLHHELEARLVASGQLRAKLAERVRKHITKAVGRREFLLRYRGCAEGDRQPGHSAPAWCCLRLRGPARREGFNKRWRGRLGTTSVDDSRHRGAVHTRWFEVIRVAYVDYLFKFAKKIDPRLDDKRLVMSQPMTAAARDLWIDITRPELRA